MQHITSSYKTLHVVHKQHMHRKVNKIHYSISIGTICTGLAFLKGNVSLYVACRLLSLKLLWCDLLLLWKDVNDDGPYMR
jgi:hypothetical protein